MNRRNSLSTTFCILTCVALGYAEIIVVPSGLAVRAEGGDNLNTGV